MPHANLNNFKTVHSIGVVKIVYNGKVKFERKYYSISERTKSLRVWNDIMFGKKYFIEIIPNWKLWNKKTKLRNKKHERRFIAATN